MLNVSRIDILHIELKKTLHLRLWYGGGNFNTNIYFATEKKHTKTTFKHKMCLIILDEINKTK